MKALREQPGSRVGFELVGGKLFYKDRVVLAANSAWIPKLLYEFHDSPTGSCWCLPYLSKAGVKCVL